MGDYVKIRRAATQSIPYTTTTAVSWDTEDSDTAGYWASGSPTRITVPTGKGGKFAFSFRYAYDVGFNQRGFTEAVAYTSGNVAYKAYRRLNGYGLGSGGHTLVTHLDDGDYVVFNLWHAISGGVAHPATATLEAVRLGTVTDFVQLRRTTTQAVNVSSYAAVSWTIEDNDLGGFWDSGTPTRIICPSGKAGEFFFTFTYTLVGPAAFGTAVALCNVIHSAVGDFVGPIGLGNEDKGSVSGVTHLDAAQYLEPSVYNNEGIDLATADFKMVRMS